jgi:uncharacterized coiled-coil DUF342 family protein
MRILIGCSIAILVIAVGVELFFLDFKLEHLIDMIMSQPLPQRLGWIAIGTAPLLLFFVAMLEHERLVQQRKTADVLATRLRGVKDEVSALETAQKDGDRATNYLLRTDPEDAIMGLQKRLAAAQQVADVHHNRNEADDLMARVEDLRRQQNTIRERLGELIAKRRSIDLLFSELQSSQEDMEQTLSSIEEDKNGDTLQERLRKLTEFIRTSNARCEMIEISLQALLEHKSEIGTVEGRLAPLADSQTGVKSLLKALHDTQDGLAATINHLENDEGMGLAMRVQQLAEARSELEQRVTALQEQFGKLDAIHRDISGLFAKLNQAQRAAREAEPGVRIVSSQAS